MDKIKILIGILSYGGGNYEFKTENLHKAGYRNQDRYLEKVLSNYNSWDLSKYDLTIRMYVTNEYDVSEYTNLTIEQKTYDESIAKNLGWQHRDWFIENRYNYDYFIWGENDVLIPQKTFETWSNIDKNLPGERDILGLMLWEIKDNMGYSIQASSRWFNPPIVEQISYNNDIFIHFTNPQSACYLICKDKFNTLLDEDLYTPSTITPSKDFKNGSNKWSQKYPKMGFPTNWESGYIRSQPSCASEIYSKGRFRKLISAKHYENLKAYHLSGDYTNGKNGFKCEDCYVTDQWFKNLIKTI